MFESRKKLLKEIDDLLAVNERRGIMVRKLQEENSDLSSSADGAIKRNEALNKQLNDRQKSLNEAAAEIKKLKAQLRDQTGADLLFNAIKAIIKSDTEVSKSEVDDHQRLLGDYQRHALRSLGRPGGAMHEQASLAAQQSAAGDFGGRRPW
jgi:chromosome segregation ATPase